MDVIIKAVVSVIATAIVSALIAYFKTLRDKQKAQDEGLQSLLRTEIIKAYDKYTERGSIPIYASEVLTHNYTAYKKLKGNGVIDSLYEELMELPKK